MNHPYREPGVPTIPNEGRLYKLTDTMWLDPDEIIGVCDSHGEASIIVRTGSHIVTHDVTMGDVLDWMRKINRQITRGM